MKEALFVRYRLNGMGGSCPVEVSGIIQHDTPILAFPLKGGRDWTVTGCSRVQEDISTTRWTYA